MFDHEKLDVYKVSIDFNRWVYLFSKALTGSNRFARDQLLRSAQSIPLNIAEGNGKSPGADRRRFLYIACGSALESSAAIDVLHACESIGEDDAIVGKKMLYRIVSMLTKMIMNIQGFNEEPVGYDP